MLRRRRRSSRRRRNCSAPSWHDRCRAPPVSNSRSPMARSRGLARSIASLSSPPIMIASVPSAARGTPPDTGGINQHDALFGQRRTQLACPGRDPPNSYRARWCRGAALRPDHRAGYTSLTTRPRGQHRHDEVGRGQLIERRGPHDTHARAATLRACSGELSNTITLWPARAMQAAIGAPMLPTPTTATFMVCPPPHGARVRRQRR